MLNTAHQSKQMERILSNVFPDRSMLIFSPLDPFHELINLSVAHDSDFYKFKFINDISPNFNVQTCDLNEPCFLYNIYPEFKINLPITMSGVINIGVDLFIPLTTCEDLEEFYTIRPNRIELNELNSGVAIDSIYNPIGIIYAHSKANRDGEVYVIMDTNPANSGSLLIYNNAGMTGVPAQSSVASVSTYSDDLYYYDPQMFIVTNSSIGPCVYSMEYYPNTDFTLYDILHLDHSGTPIVISNSEYTLSENELTLIEYSGGRPSYNSDYYDSPTNSGQPDKFWDGLYAANFSYAPFTGVSYGLATTNYLHSLSSIDDTFIYPNTPKEQEVSIPFEAAESSHNFDAMYRCFPVYVRPGIDVTVKVNLTRRIIEEWVNKEDDYIYTISDSNFVSTNIEAIKLFIMGSEYLITDNVTIVDNTITITALDSDFITKYSTSNWEVYIYYKAYVESIVTTIASYTDDTINYAQDFAINDVAEIVPYSIIPVSIDGLNEDFANGTLDITTLYDLRGLAYDPYKRVMWSFENNNKFLVERDINTLAIINNYPLFKNPNRGIKSIDGVNHKLIDYTIVNSYEFVSLKYLDGFLYFLSTEDTMYALNSTNDYNYLDFNYDINGNITDPIFSLGSTGSVVDFTFDKYGNMIILRSDKTAIFYNCFKDYAYIDILRNQIYFREKYDEIEIVNGPGISR